MADTSIGGYVATLRLITAQEDFDRGIRAISETEVHIRQTAASTKIANNNWSEFTMGLYASLAIIKQVGEALKGLYENTTKPLVGIATNTIGTGLSPTQALDVSYAANIYGVKSQSLLTGLKPLAETFYNPSLYFNNNIAKQMGVLASQSGSNLDYSRLSKENMNDVISEIMAAAEKLGRTGVKGQRQGLDAVQGILGAGYGQIYQRDLAQRSSYADVLAAGTRSNAYTPKDLHDSMETQSMLNEFKNIASSITGTGLVQLFHDLALELKPMTEWMEKNKELLKGAASGAANTFGMMLGSGASLSRFDLATAGTFGNLYLNNVAGWAKGYTRNHIEAALTNFNLPKLADKYEKIYEKSSTDEANYQKQPTPFNLNIIKTDVAELVDLVTKAIVEAGLTVTDQQRADATTYNIRLATGGH